MANEYLNKATDSTGSVIYTASEKDVDGKPTTRVYFDQPQPMQLTGSNVDNGETDVVTAGTPVALSADQKCRSILVRAKDTNEGVITIGQSNPTFPLSAGEALTINANNLNNIYIDAELNGEGVHWIAEV